MRPLRRSTTAPAAKGLFVVFLLLVVALLVPTLCVLWFLAEAVGNERLAVHQRLTTAYRAQLDAVSRKAQEAWQRRLAGEGTGGAGEGSAPARFAALCVSGACDSAVLLDRSEVPAYPDVAADERGDTAPIESAVWAEAELAESTPGGDLREAARMYGAIAEHETSDSALVAHALHAQARVLLKAGDTTAALQVLTGPLADPQMAEARGAGGRLLWPAAQLLALELLKAEGREAEFTRGAQRLAEYLRDYRRLPGMSSAQRVFLMGELQALANDQGLFPTLQAERLAASYLACCSGTEMPEPGVVSPSPLEGIWHARLSASDPAGSGGAAILLYSERAIRAGLEPLLSEQFPAGSDAEASLLAPGQASPPVSDKLLVALAAPALPGWRWVLRLSGSDPFAQAAGKRTALYSWIAALAILTLAVVIALIARHLLVQTRLAQLKNDFVAAVTHELKTPLSSMRVFVDTMLDEPSLSERDRREYLELVNRENVRLSRLIDNFLTFSRMERNKQVFELKPVSVAKLLEQSVEAAGERFRAPGCRLEVRAEGERLPEVLGDVDALSTVVLNLLDNAYKYSGAHKQIVLRACRQGQEVCLSVADNGIGIPRRAHRRIFERFYQVDQSLSRQQGGCGLGLSIVQFIVAAHGGKVRVESEPGKGSTFTVCLPIAASSPHDPDPIESEEACPEKRY